MTTFEHRGITYNIPKEIFTNFIDIDDHFDTKNGKFTLSMIKYYIDNGEIPTREQMKKKEYSETYGVNFGDNIIDKISTDGRREATTQFKEYFESKEGLESLKKDNPDIYFDDKGMPSFDRDTGEPLTVEQFQNISGDQSKFNPYTQWLEQQRMTAEGQELGLLNQQTRAGQQNAEISAQQSMIQQAQLRDQIVEQIKLDRMSKMRQGITPMQIANESLQFTVGNIQANNQQITGVNQARLAATQQQGLNPYQAYLNSVNGVGYQTQGNVASGMAATDASDMYQQAMKYAKSQGRNHIKPEDYDKVQGVVR